MMWQDWQFDINWAAVQSWTARIIAALVILAITHFVAKAVKWAIARVVDRIPALRRHWRGQTGDSIGTQIGALGYWLVWLVGLVAALAPLGLSGVMAPINGLTSTAFAFIPNLIGAGLIFFFGYIVATIARRVVETGLAAANVDGWLARARVGEVVGETPSGGLPLSKAIGLVVFVLIIIPVATAALQALHLTSLSSPLVTILQSVGLFVPRLIAAGLILALAYLIARCVQRWAVQLLNALGFDRALAGSGLVPSGVSASAVVGTIALTAIMLIAATAAVDVLDIPALEAMIAQLTVLGGHVLFGAVIIGVGVVLARILSGIVAGASDGDGFAPAIVRYAVIALTTAMGLRFMGLANEIVNLAFGLILGSAAVACALAFGLGGRATAHKLLDRWVDGDRP